MRRAQSVHAKARHVEAAPEVQGRDVFSRADRVSQAYVREFPAVAETHTFQQRTSLQHYPDGIVPQVETPRQIHRLRSKQR